MRMPRWLLRHQVEVERRTDGGPYGPGFEAPVTVRCMADEQVRQVRSPSGAEVVSSLTLHCAPDTDEIPGGSRVTYRGRVSTVISSHRRDGGGLPTPDHLEVRCE